MRSMSKFNLGNALQNQNKVVQRFEHVPEPVVKPAKKAELLRSEFSEKSGAPMRNLLHNELESVQSDKKIYSMRVSPKRTKGVSLTGLKRNINSINI